MIVKSLCAALALSLSVGAACAQSGDRRDSSMSGPPTAPSATENAVTSGGGGNTAGNSPTAGNPSADSPASVNTGGPAEPGVAQRGTKDR